MKFDARDAYAARFNYGLRAIYRDLKEQEKRSPGVLSQASFPAITPLNKITQKGAAMILNREQQKAVENGEPLALNVAGTECVLVRRDFLLVSPGHPLALHTYGRVFVGMGRA